VDEKAHRIGIEVLNSKGPSYDSYPTAEAAASAFDEELRRANDPELPPGLVRLRLWEGRQAYP
jgi:hypothetical protein